MTATYTASYTISGAAANTSKISNSVVAVGSSPGSTNDVTDTSDDGNDSDGNTTDDATETATDPLLPLKLLKQQLLLIMVMVRLALGDVINYVIAVKNTGNVLLSSVSVTDILKDGNNTTLSMSNGPYFSGSDQGSAEGTVKPGETATYRAYYIIEVSVLNSGSISNTASATGSSPGNTNDVSDVSDDAVMIPMEIL